MVCFSVFSGFDFDRDVNPKSPCRDRFNLVILKMREYEPGEHAAPLTLSLSFMSVSHSRCSFCPIPSALNTSGRMIEASWLRDLGSRTVLIYPRAAEGDGTRRFERRSNSFHDIHEWLIVSAFFLLVFWQTFPLFCLSIVHTILAQCIVDIIDDSSVHSKGRV